MNQQDLRSLERESFEDYVPSQKFFNFLVKNICGRTMKYGNSEVIFSKSPSKDLFTYNSGIEKAIGSDFENGKKIFRCKYQLFTRIKFMDSDLAQSSYFYLNVWMISDNLVSYSITDTRSSYRWTWSHKRVEQSEFIEKIKNPFDLI